jgi:hypothetical protein
VFRGLPLSVRKKRKKHKGQGFDDNLLSFLPPFLFLCFPFPFFSTHYRFSEGTFFLCGVWGPMIINNFLLLTSSRIGNQIGGTEKEMRSEFEAERESEMKQKKRKRGAK